MFSERVRYAVQILSDMEVLGCCDLDWLAGRYAAELSFDRGTLKKVVARLALFGILHYEYGAHGENLYLTVSPESVSVYALVSAIDRKIEFCGGLHVGETPHPDTSLKELTVQHLIDARYMIRETDLRQSAAGRIRLAVERERKHTGGEFMPMRHADAAAVLDGDTRRKLMKQRRINRFHEVMGRIEALAKDR